MKWIKYEQQGQVRWGLQQGEQVQALLAGGDGEAAVLAALRNGDPGIRPSGPVSDLAAVRLLPPLVAGATLYCIGLNYKAHVAETGRDLPPQPSVFTRTHDSIVGAGSPIVRPRVSTDFDFEGELAMIVGAPGRHIAEADAMRHVAGYTCFMDGSLRDYQKQSVTAGKNFWCSGACGPAIVSADEIADPQQLRLQTRLNGETVQQATTDLLIYSMARIVSYLSGITLLKTGDLIATGTPSGVGARRTPPLWMKPGDRLEVEIAGVGLLQNPVIDE